MKKVLVTGGLGIIGSFVARAVLASSRQPVIYDLGGDTALIRDIAVDCVIERGDICDLPRLMGLVAQHKPDAILHLAGQIGPQVEQFPWSSLNANLMGTATVFECARLAGVQRIVFPSSKMAYGPVAEKHRHPSYEPVPEEHPLEPSKHYGRMKRALEGLADNYARLYGLDIIALRFGSAFGPGKFGRHGQVSSLMAVIEAAIANRPIAIERGGDQRDDLCYSGESANGFMSALQSVARPGTSRAYNIASGELISLREIIGVLRDLYPSWNAEVGAGTDYRGIGSGFYFKMSTEKAQAELGFKPRFDFRRAVIDYAQTLERLKVVPGNQACRDSLNGKGNQGKDSD